MKTDDTPELLRPAEAALVDRKIANVASRIASGRSDPQTIGEVSRLIRERADLLLPASFSHDAKR